MKNSKYSVLNQQTLINEKKIDELRPFIKSENRTCYESDFSNRAVFDIHNIKEYTHFTTLTVIVRVKNGLSIYSSNEIEKIKIYLSELLFNNSSKIDMIEIDIRDSKFNPFNIILNGIDVLYNEYRFIGDSFIKLHFLNKFIKQNCKILDLLEDMSDYIEWINQMLDYSLRIDKILIQIDKFVARAEILNNRAKIRGNLDDIDLFIEKKLT